LMGKKILIEKEELRAMEELVEAAIRVIEALTNGESTGGKKNELEE